MAKYKNIYESWKKNPINFWKNLSKDIDWNTKPSKILDNKKVKLISGKNTWEGECFPTDEALMPLIETVAKPLSLKIENLNEELYKLKSELALIEIENSKLIEKIEDNVTHLDSTGDKTEIILKEGSTSQAFVNLLNENKFFSGIIETVPEEGSLAPGKYFFKIGEKREKIISKLMLIQRANIGRAWLMRSKDIEVSNPRELLILASIVEKETVISSEELSFTTIKEYANRLSSESDGKILYCTDEISQSNPLNLWKAQGKEIIIADTVIDSQFIPWLETRNEKITFQRVDSEIDDSLNSDDKEITDVDGDNMSESLRELIKSALNNDKITVQIKSLKDNYEIPAMILLPEQMRRINDMGALMEQKLPGLPDNHVLLVNKNHPIVEGLSKLKSSSIIIDNKGGSQNTLLIKEISVHLYEMACLSIGGLDPEKMSDFQKKSSGLMGKLISKIT